MSSHDGAGVGLADAIRTLRAELTLATAEGDGQQLRFHVGQVELEFQVEVTRDVTGSSGVKFWVVSADATGSLARANTHRVQLTLQPLVVSSETGLIQDALVSESIPDRPR